ncbi:MAG: bifunctional diaminohydroxyphosphoribosylaminopyrimidine deaminase/5-amino-6-(5-phosphoribosylamino)uracil reductase RibD [Planctomycetes bacterium]|nr:bifunctional diaminohydroxyphosphoribosylaminopyrimidine deaminase/5-amino-6-(5-phosphoribosylamino)uracil reductase RibD [Planctomycetota bacterium]
MHEELMKRALELARLGIGSVEPNPPVGCVIAKDDCIIGGGFHEFFGGPHAEINALQTASESVRGADMYVTLEPCAHHGKTAPCVDAIIEAEIARVIVASTDGFESSGGGADKLRAAGIEVVTGFLETEAEAILRAWRKNRREQKPWVIAKWAMTLDGRISTDIGDSKWITSERSRSVVHLLRAKCQAVITGIGTVLKDDPELTVRLVEGSNPARVVIDPERALPEQCRLFDTIRSAPVVQVSSADVDAPEIDSDERGFHQLSLPAGEIARKVMLTPDGWNALLRALYEGAGGIRPCGRVMIEAGPGVLTSAFRAGIVDAVYVFVAPKIIGGVNLKIPTLDLGIEKMAEAITFSEISVEDVDGEALITGLVNRVAKC